MSSGRYRLATDVVEILSRNSVPHGGEEQTIKIADTDWQRLAPDVVLVLTREDHEFSGCNALREALEPEYPVIFFSFDTRLFRLDD